MRPLELRLRNFRSYFGDEAIFSFRDRSLVGIVGPIGAGKSSILDAISFALYGKTPTVAAATKSLIHQRAAEATVALRFEVDGQVWEAVRMLRVKGQSQHALYRFDGDEPDAEPAERITMEADVNARIVELLGLEFDAFGRSVLLAQGRFAEFLRARPAERDKVLKGVFGHERIDAMREVAKSRGGVLGIELEKLGVRVEQLDRVAARLEDRQAKAKELDKRVKQLRKAEPKLRDLDLRIIEAAKTAAAAEQRLAEIRELAGRLPDPDATSELFAGAAGAAETRSALAAGLESAQGELTAAEANVAAAEAAGVVQTIEDATRQLAVVEPLVRAVAEATGRLDRAERRRAKLDESLEQAAAREAGAIAAETNATEELASRMAAVEKAEAVLLELRHADMSMTLRADLHDGGTCPVCSQEVAAVPPVAPSEDLATAENTLAQARRGREQADTVRVKAAGEAQGSREALAALESEHDRLAAEHTSSAEMLGAAERDLAEARSVLVGLLGKGDPAELLARRKQDVESRGGAVTDARKALERVRADHDAAIRHQQGLGKRLTALRIDLADLAARLDVDVVLDDEAPAALQLVLDQLRAAWGAVTASLDTTKADATSEQAAATSQRSDLLSGLAIDGDFGVAVGNAVAEAELTKKAMAEDRAEIDAAAELLERRDALTAERGRFEQISTDLTDSRFVRYLLDDERTRLAALGSEHFERLSSGRYRFSEDGKFEIVDLTTAEAVRKADSLSGGETFLASLALALGLAEMVARTGGRLDAFFLDEGFGSLDPEHLDLAMEGIEALVADGSDRLVVVVSHVPEMRARVEDLIILDRDAVTGDTRVLSA